jgi:hypothetical protein
MTRTKQLLEQIAALPGHSVNYRSHVVIIIQEINNGVRQSSVWLNRKNTNRNLEAFLPAAEPDLGQMFDMAYEDQCRDACGL